MRNAFIKVGIHVHGTIVYVDTSRHIYYDFSSRIVVFAPSQDSQDLIENK